MQHKLLTPEEIASQAGAAIPFLRLPDRGSIFADRATRLHALAPGHAMGGYLEFIALVAEEQQKLLDDMPPVRLPSPETIQQCNEHAMPPLNFQTYQRDQQWCNALRYLLRALAERTEGKTREVVVRLEQTHDELYEAQASKLLAGITFGLDAATAPLIGAGLQVYFTHMAIALGHAAFPRIDVATICPSCGSRPTASVARIGAKEAGYRFLHCSLCNAEWHMVRIKCSNCESTKGISYHVIDDGGPVDKKAVRAEVCDECETYLKICHMDRDPRVEAVADDLATLPLDLLVTDTGKTSSGVNFMLIHGDPESP
ncbi:MAG TPA: formate dehydrogenase accessory protein FdhE [Casimicrobiaceae bacterium]|nr:formate dehydrogenase accessory protein FdhE [Casimicrobiaceae bacterium]